MSDTETETPLYPEVVVPYDPAAELVDGYVLASRTRAALRRAGHDREVTETFFAECGVDRDSPPYDRASHVLATVRKWVTLDARATR